MATRTVTATKTTAADFTEKLVAAADGPGGSNFVDGRLLSSILAQTAQFVWGNFTPGTTTDDDGNTIASTDDLEISCGFIPKLAILTMVDGASTAFYIKSWGLHAAAIKDYSWYIAPAAAQVFTDNTIRFHNIAEDDRKYCTLLDGALTNAKAHYYFILG